MATAEASYERIAAKLAERPGVVRAKMFGMPGVKFKGKAFTGLFGEDMVFKLGAGSAGHAKALALKGSVIWDPSGMGRAFKDWVQVPSAHAKTWSTFADRAFDCVIMWRFLHHIGSATTRQAILREAARVTRRKVLVSFHHPISFTHWRKLVRTAPTPPSIWPQAERELCTSRIFPGAAASDCNASRISAGCKCRWRRCLL